MSIQKQFLGVVDRDEAERRFQAAIPMAPLGAETVPLEAALERVLADDVIARVDVPSFDRSNVDGFAVRASDTFGADEERPRALRRHEETVPAGACPQGEVTQGVTMAVSTGGMLPCGADAVVMVEYTDIAGPNVQIYKPVAAGAAVTYAGTDLAAGETVLRRGEVLTSRETGVLAAIGVETVSVWRRPKVAIVSTGDELISPGQPMTPGKVYDSNARILSDAVRQLGGEPLMLGIVTDDLEMLRSYLRKGLAAADLVVLSGGTSKGDGDLSYQVVAERNDPGIIVHGVALKPGKPICLAASEGKPVVILPGFPTSAIFTFHEFVAPVIRSLGGQSQQKPAHVTARLATHVKSDIGRAEFVLVGLVKPPPPSQGPLVAFPMGKGSGSVTTFSRADGFVTIDRHTEFVEIDTEVEVTLLGRELVVADLVVIGSHCIGVDLLLGKLQDQGFHTKFLAVGSTAGLAAARRGECDVAGMHLLDPVSGTYNRPFLTPELELIPGYGRMQGIVFRPGDTRFAEKSATEAIATVQDDPTCVMVSRNQGSGTRVLIDQILGEHRPPGYAVQPRNHNAVAAAVAQGRADWGVAIEVVALRGQLGFLPLTLEQYDLVIPKSRRERPAVIALRQLLADETTRDQLTQLGLTAR